MPLPRPLAAAALFLLLPPAPCPAADPFAFADGDQVVFLGSTLIEREQKYGFWELFLTLKNKDKAVTFRNLGWSGDTVYGEARGRFDYQNPQKCFEQLVGLTKELKPTVVVICYGHNESFDGKPGVERFAKGLDKLIDALADTKARVVLMSPTPFEKSPKLADPAARNADLALYRDATKAVAEKRGAAFVDLLELVRMADLAEFWRARMYDNGLHLSEVGYILTAPFLSIDKPEEQLGLWYDTVRLARVMQQLRKAIVAKNELFFHRWRPQNETYLFGFRKHEQGKNAKEVAEFDPLVAAAEKEIGSLRSQVTGGK